MSRATDGSQAAPRAREVRGEASSPFASVPLFELLVLALGFGLCRVWVVDSMSVSAGHVFLPRGAFQLDQVYLFGGAVAAILVALFARRVFDSPAGLQRLNCLTVALLVLSFVAMVALNVAGGSLLAVVTFVLSGATSGLLQVSWGERFVRHGMRLALLASPVAAIVTALIMMAIPVQATMACYYVAPLLSLALLFANRGEAGTVVLSLRPQRDDVRVLSEVATEERRGALTGPTLARLMASIAVFSLIGRCLDSFPIGSDESAPAFIVENYAFLAILAVGVLFVALVLALGSRFDTLLVYRFSLPLMVAGFVVLTLFMDRYAIVSISIITIGYEFFDVLFWAMLVGVVRQGGRWPVETFGWGVACTYVGMGVGTLVSRACARRISDGTLDITVFSLMSILVLVLLVVLVLPEGTMSKVLASRSKETRQAGGDGLARRCASVAARYDLTPRERDVFLLIARGRTLGVVSRELNIAEGTARTHMGHIYAKLGVHRQQELIDLVEAEPVESEGVVGA